MTTTCPTCNSELLTSNGQTFCPACLLQQGMKSSTYGGGSRVAWKPPEIEQLSAAFPHLEIQQLLGVGGMGAVFKVRQKELDRIAALKVLPGEMAADAGFTERFLREARLLASLSHPHIVTVYEFGQRDGIYFLLMEFIDGVTLRQALRAEPIKKLGSKETLAIVGQLCDALQFAHDEGVVHRDIKPENILIDKRGRVKIADFGLARLLGQSPTMPTLTRTHQLMGTPAYMAPEQIEGLPGIDHRADIYSMGVVFYELLTGELPLGRFSPPSERAETDVRLDEVVLRTLAREPDRRYQQASQVKTDVESLGLPQVTASHKRESAASASWRIGFAMIGLLLGVVCTTSMLFYLDWSAGWLSQEKYLAQEMERSRIVGEVNQKKVAELDANGFLEKWRLYSEFEKEKQRRVQAGEPPLEEHLSTDFARIQAVESMPSIVIDNSIPMLNSQHFQILTDQQRAAVNTILKETHDRYLKEEALHSIVSVDANGVQTTEISAFPDQLRAIENEMWTKLDDAVPVEIQKEFRTQLNLYTIDGPNDDSGSMGMSGYGGGPGMGMGMGSPIDGRMGMSAGTMGASPGTGPGLLGWEAEHYPLMIKISRSGRWFEWTIDTSASEVDPTEKAPTLPSPLQRFYREPGPWMAVANAQATYAAKNWMKLADYFTAEAMTREWVVAMADAERVNGNPELQTADIQRRLSQRFNAEASRTKETEEMVRIGSGQEHESTDFNNTHLRPLMSELAGVSATDVDGPIARVTKAIPLQAMKQHFGWTVLARWIVVEEGLDGPSDFAALHGEVASYTETGDTASATLTIPNKPPVPIRFKRENGQWKIDAIGSNERLLERLKQTYIRKQHAEIEAVFGNAQAAYAKKDWQKLTDCFTHTGRVCWGQYAFYEPSNLLERPGGLPIAQEDAQAEMRALVPNFVSFEKSDLAVIRSAAFDRLLAQACVAKPADVRGIFSQATELLSEEFSRTSLSTRLIQFRDRFSLSSSTLSDLQVSGDVGSGTLVSADASRRVKVAFRREAGQWKFDMVMSPEELQSLLLKQFARRLDRLLPDVLDSYQKGAWLVASESFTTAGQLRWLLEAEARAQEAHTGLSPELAERRVEIRKDAVERTKHLSSVDPASMEEFDTLRNKLATANIAEIEQLLASFCKENPPEKIQTRFMLAIADLSACGLPFEPPKLTLKDVKVAETHPETKVVALLVDSDLPVCFKIDQDKWKIDSLGSLEQLQQHARLFLPAEDTTPPTEATPVDGATGVP